MGFFSKMSQKFQGFMYGRYGIDQFNIFLMVLALITSLIPYYIANIVALVLMALELLRMFSKNIYARQKENRVFLKAWNPIRSFFVRIFKRPADSKTHKHFSCPKCAQHVRVPRGKGKIMIICPKCGEKFSKKT